MNLPPVIICPDRSLEILRVPPHEGRLLILSCIPPGHDRATAELAVQRNRFGAALADEHWFAHIAPDGQTEKLSRPIAGLSPITPA